MAQRTPSGPSSRYVVTPAASRARTPSRKQTASRACRTQKSAVPISSETSAPVRFETTGIRRAAKVSPSTTWRKSSSMPSMCGEWNAWLTERRLDLRSGKAFATATAACSSPATTTERGPLTAAMLTPLVSSGRTSPSEASSAIITPPPGSACISRPRAATSVHASSRDSTPATCAAAISPIE
ncbi:hypothetical protein EES37_20510 [Streptomyces sp. ADI91-18]|nr:hypothetical protein EES37_20510 [Streptomyces sp. ADI91-18]